MRVIFAIFLVVILLNGDVSAGKAGRRRRRRQLQHTKELLRQLTCSASRVVLNIPKNTCPNIPGWAPHSEIIHFDNYITLCDANCIVKPRMGGMQFYYSLITFCIIICTYLLLFKPLLDI